MEIEITRTLALISINATLVVQLLSFLIFMMLISRLMYKPLQDIAAERDRQLDLMKKEIETAEVDLEDILFKIEEEKRNARDEAFAVQQRLEKDGAVTAENLFAEVTSEIEKINEETKSEVDRQIQEARRYLHQESERLAGTIMEKALDRRLAYE